LANAKLEDGSYDIVTMNHVLEHVPNPDEIASIVFRLLKKGGIFYGFIPNSDCIERRVFGKYWKGYDLPNHFTWFSKKNLRRFLTDIGFSSIKCISQPHVKDWQVSFKNYLYYNGYLKTKIKAFNGHNVGIYFLSAPILIIFSWFGYGSIQKFIAKK
jgi:SAM-dependent methyltransferase